MPEAARQLDVARAVFVGAVGVVCQCDLLSNAVSGQCGLHGVAPFVCYVRLNVYYNKELMN